MPPGSTVGGIRRLQIMSAPRRPPADRPVGSASQKVLANPLLDAFEEATAAGHNDGMRSQLIARYGFAVPSDEALTAIERCSPQGVIELGAGTGYWAFLLQQRGVDVVAFDIEPAPVSAERVVRWHPAMAPGAPR